MDFVVLRLIHVVGGAFWNGSGRRARSRARTGEVLVSSTTGGLLEGSGMELEDAGLHELKGLSGERQVFRLVVPPTM
jgi:class 3 adenylate cyclase